MITSGLNLISPDSGPSTSHVIPLTSNLNENVDQSSQPKIRRMSSKLKVFTTIAQKNQFEGFQQPVAPNKKAPSTITSGDQVDENQHPFNFQNCTVTVHYNANK